MNLKQYYITMGLATVLCWVAWWLILTNVDPFTATWVGHSFFYASFLLALLGTCAIFWTAIFSIRRNTARPFFHDAHTAFRYACIISGGATLTLYLQSLGVLRWWNSLMLVTALFLLVVVSRSRQRSSFTL